jgi:hypothetical protein
MHKHKDLAVTIGCDTSEIDAALTKLDLLMAKAQQAQALGVLPVIAGAAGAASAAARTTVTRRGLLGLSWLSR